MAPAWRRLLPVDGARAPAFNPNLYGQHPVFEIAALDSRTSFALFSMMTLQRVYTINRGRAGAVSLDLPHPACALVTHILARRQQQHTCLPACAYGQSLVNNCLGIIKCN